MAKIKSAIATSIRGSIGGITFFPGKHNSILARARVVPAHPNTERQQNAKDAFAQAIAKWTSLSGAVRNEWNQWASSITRTNKMGDSYTPSGRQEFITSYSLIDFLYRSPGMLFYGMSFVENPVPPDELGLQPPPDTIISVDGPSVVGTGFEVSCGVPATEDQAVFVQIGNPVSDAVKYYRGPWSEPVSQDQNIMSLNKSGALVTVDFTDLVEGYRYPVRIRCFTDPTNAATNYGVGVNFEGIYFATAVENAGP
jgi:hypothetical protein